MANPFTIHYLPAAPPLAVSLFGHALADEEIAWLAGALDGAEVIVSSRKSGLYLEVKDAPRFAAYETSIRTDADGSLWDYLHDVRIAAGLGGQGLGLQAFLRQIQMARALGLTRFELWAAGHPGDQAHNGWITWAKFGFDAPLNKYELAALPRAYATARTVNDIMFLGADDWWAKTGSERSMVFDLYAGSSMMSQFRRYLKKKGYTL